MEGLPGPTSRLCRLEAGPPPSRAARQDVNGWSDVIMGRPIIGLTTYGEQTKFGSNDTFSAVLPMAYVHAVHVSGGRAVLVTQDDPDPDVLADLDGLIITGGADVEPARYGEIATRTYGVPAGPGRGRVPAAACRHGSRPADARHLPGHAVDGGGLRRPAVSSTCPTYSATTDTGPGPVPSSASTRCGSRPAHGALRSSGRLDHRELVSPSGRRGPGATDTDRVGAG